MHPKAMPVFLTNTEEVDVWLNAPTPAALELLRPSTHDKLKIVARGARQDGGAESFPRAVRTFREAATDFIQPHVEPKRKGGRLTSPYSGRVRG